MGSVAFLTSWPISKKFNFFRDLFFITRDQLNITSDQFRKPQDPISDVIFDLWTRFAECKC